eukprot:TRINITY_DN2866_c0_g1_i2.p1 TRINITY_DN2866_c0_g1~~TRINITY_DN2866_c0_g1_i2.p1  ORF type:complete len:361 (+),score=67.56 TRINITY_DN2866_c0_g1_i2:60-1142(+)
MSSVLSPQSWETVRKAVGVETVETMRRIENAVASRIRMLGRLRRMLIVTHSAQPTPPAVRDHGELTLHVGREVGGGAFGTVYEVLDVNRGQLLAMKREHASSQDESRVRKEIAIMQRLHHDNIVEFHSFVEAGGSINILMEFVPDNMHSRLRQYGRFSEGVIAEYGKQMLDGVAHLHSCNIVHRDIKSFNCLLQNGQVKLCDFGCSCVVGPVARRRSAAGSVRWMSPEVLRDRCGYGADIWATGCTILEMLTAREPWHPAEFGHELALARHICAHPEGPPVPPCTDQLSDVLRLAFCPFDSRPAATTLRSQPFFNAGTSAAGGGVTIFMPVLGGPDDELPDDFETVCSDYTEAPTECPSQ